MRNKKKRNDLKRNIYVGCGEKNLTKKRIKSEKYWQQDLQYLM